MQVTTLHLTLAQTMPDAVRRIHTVLPKAWNHGATKRDEQVPAALHNTCQANVFALRYPRTMVKMRVTHQQNYFYSCLCH